MRRARSICQKTRTDYYPTDCRCMRACAFRIQTTRPTDQLLFSAEKSYHCGTCRSSVSPRGRQKILITDHRRICACHEDARLCHTEFHLFTDERRHPASHRNRAGEAGSRSQTFSPSSLFSQRYFFQDINADRFDSRRTRPFISTFSRSRKFSSNINQLYLSRCRRPYPAAHDARNQRGGGAREPWGVCVNLTYFFFFKPTPNNLFF